MSDRRLELLFERFRRQGDVDALGQVFDATAPALRRVARHLTRDAAEAEDLVQATFLAAIEKRASFDAARELSSWLTGILLRQASLERRARARVVEPDRLDPRDAEDPAEAVAARELSDALTVALSRLRPVDREVLIPLLLDGRRAVEIARELGSRPDTVHMRIHRGLERLRRLLPAGLALGLMARLAGARGLGSVRAEVLRHASVEMQLAPVAASGAVIVGVAMSTKKLAFLAVLTLVVGAGAYHAATGARDEAVAHDVQLEDRAVAPADEVAHQSPDDARARAAIAAPNVAVESNAPVARELVLDVVRAAGGVVAGALVALVDVDGAVTSARTDAEGRCAFTPKAGAGHLYVRDEGEFPRHFALELAPGRRTIELPRGAELSGRFAMHGGDPLPRVDLRLKSDTAPEGLSTASAGVYRALDLLEYGEPSLVAHTTPAADGTFRFRTPDAEWSGILRLPEVFQFVEGAQLTSSSEKLIERPAVGLELVVAYRPRVVGRLVDADTRRPIALSRFECVISWVDGNELMSGGITDDDGRFAMAVDSRVDAVTIDIGTIRAPDGRTARGKAPRQWKGPCIPFDAGDVECAFAASRPLAVHVVDPEGLPLPRARVLVGELEPAVADERGLATLAAVPLDARKLTAVAPGHAITVVAIDERTASPLEVILPRTNRLTIELPREHAERRDVNLHLVSRELLFGGKSRMYTHVERGEMVGRTFWADGDAGTREGRVAFGFDASGRIELEGITTGVAFRARLVGGDPDDARRGILAEVPVEPMGVDEQRTIRFELAPEVARALSVVRGRVTDEAGRPIHDAGVAGHFNRNEAPWAGTEMDGTFRLELIDVVTTDFAVTKRGYLPFRVRDFDVTAGRPIDVTLHRSRDVRLELADAQGRAIPGAAVDAEIAGFGPVWRVEHGAAGVFTLCDVPAGRIALSIAVGGARYEREFVGAGAVARVVLPTHGRVEVAWRTGAERGGSKRCFVALRPVGTEGVAQVTTTWQDAEVETNAFEAVLLGTYAVWIEFDPDPSESDGPLTPLVGPKRITVVAGETVRVEL